MITKKVYLDLLMMHGMLDSNESGELKLLSFLAEKVLSS